jgi:hypothetical protein
MLTETLLPNAGEPSGDDDSSQPHAIAYPLESCPQLPRGTRYRLIGRDHRNSPTVVAAGVALNSHALMNIAFVRQRGAKLGATEVLVLRPPSTATLSPLTRKSSDRPTTRDVEATPA